MSWTTSETLRSAIRSGASQSVWRSQPPGTNGHTGPARPRSLCGLATKVLIQSATLRSSAVSTSWMGKRLLVCAGMISSPLRVLGENVVFGRRDRVAREPALGVVPLRRHVSQRGGREHVGPSVILEDGITPSAAVREPRRVLNHEFDVIHSTRHLDVVGDAGTLLRSPL